jgi:hypothetical protein
MGFASDLRPGSSDAPRRQARRHLTASTVVIRPNSVDVALSAAPLATSPTDAADFHVVTDLARLGLGQGLRCDCAAGLHHQACSHRTAVVLRRQREQQRTGAGP